MGRLFAARKLVDGPFPEHYEPLESPIGTNPPAPPKIVQTPAMRVFDSIKDRIGKAEEFPYVATTYRLTDAFPILDEIREIVDDWAA